MMATSPFEVPGGKKLEMPEGYWYLDVFPVDQATLVAEQRGEGIGSFHVPGSERELRHVGHDPIWDGGNYDTGEWWLTRLYTEGPHHDLDIATMLKKSPAVVAHKLAELKKHLDDPKSDSYFVVVDSLVHPTRHDDSQLHRLARLREVGMTDNHELFSVLEQEDGGLGYLALTPVKGTVQSALYR
jgi:hypothetical protein